MIMKQFFQAQISSCFLKQRQWSLRKVRSSEFNHFISPCKQGKTPLTLLPMLLAVFSHLSLLEIANQPKRRGGRWLGAL